MATVNTREVTLTPLFKASRWQLTVNLTTIHANYTDVL